MSIVQGTLPVGSLDHAITLNVQSSGGSHFETVTNTTPYLHRASPQDVASSMNLKKVVGGTIAWNQLVQNGNFESTSGWASTRGTQAVSNNELTYTVTQLGGGGLQNRTVRSISFPKGHKVFVALEYYATKEFKVRIGLGGSNFKEFILSNGVTTSAWNRLSTICQNAVEDVTELRIGSPSNSGSMAVGDTYKFRNVMIIDLTQMFGSTIADYIYSLEQAHAGDGVAWFKALFPKAYYSYNAGELMSVKTSAHKTVGFNQWDEDWETGGINPSTGVNNSTLSPSRIRSKNYIHVVPSTIYCLTIGVKGQSCVVCFYDADKNYISGGWRSTGLFTTPTNCYYIRFTTNDEYGGTYNNDICINFSSSRNGEYEPYEEHTYPLDDNLTLRGIPKLDSNNELYYDGDTYASDGTVQRKYGIVDLGTLNYNYDSTNNRFSTSNIPVKIAPQRTLYFMSDRYTTIVNQSFNIDWDMVVYNNNNIKNVIFHNHAYTDPQAFKTAMSGVYLVYELATPTTESADAYTQSQRVGATEEFVDGRTVEIPVGNVSEYKRLIQED